MTAMTGSRRFARDVVVLMLFWFGSIVLVKLQSMWWLVLTAILTGAVAWAYGSFYASRSADGPTRYGEKP